MRSADVYCAPNTGGESFGIVLVEAMAAGTAVVASDLDAFRRVLEDGAAGRLVPVDDPAGAGRGADRGARPTTRPAQRYVEAATKAVRRYDWSVVARQILRVYETVAGAGAKVQRRRAERSDPGDGDRARKRSGAATRGPLGRGCEPARIRVITWIVVIALVVLAVVLLVGGIWAFQTANRLDRLHVRYDLSWQALDGTAGAPRRGRARGGDRRLRPGRRGQAVGRAGRRGRAGAAHGAGGGRERAVRGARAGGSRVAAGGAGRRAGRRRGARAAGPPLPQRRRARHPGAA